MFLSVFSSNIYCRCIHMEANQRDDKLLVLQFTNCIYSYSLILQFIDNVMVIGICDSNPETRTTFSITNTVFSAFVNLYTNREVAHVRTASPASPVQVDLPYTKTGVGCNIGLSFGILRQFQFNPPPFFSL